MLIEGINVIAQAGIDKAQIQDIVTNERKLWKKKGKMISKIELTLDGEEIIIKTTELSHITRTRRITGYLSTEDRFNDAKLAELHDRVANA